MVRVTAAPVVPLDLLCASGTSYFGVPATPYVPGGQGVGIVESSESLAPGTRVWFFATAGMRPGDGSLAELAAVPDADVVPLADEVPDPLAVLGLALVVAAGIGAERGGGRGEPHEPDETEPDETERIRMHALENIARDGFPQVGGQTIEGLLADGLIRRQPGRVPFALTLPGVELLIEKRQAVQS